MRFSGATIACTLAVSAIAAVGCADPAPDAPTTTDPDAGAVTTTPDPVQPPAGRVAIAPTPTFVVASITDGDTLRLRGGARVRLVQIDTPETHGGTECGGRAATRALEQLAPPGSRVRLVRDPATDPADRYGRLLRYVLVGSRNVNVTLVARGHAAPYFYQGERGRYAAQLERNGKRSAKHVARSLTLHVQTAKPKLWKRPAAEITTDDELPIR